MDYPKYSWRTIYSIHQEMSTELVAKSAAMLLQAFEQNDFAKGCVAPAKGIQKSAFFEAINNRGLEQLGEVFAHLVKEAFPATHKQDIQVFKV